MKPDLTLMLLPLLVTVASCGGRAPDEPGAGAGDDVPGAVTELVPFVTPLATLRERCAPAWKLPDVGGSIPPSKDRMTGRWLRCPEDVPAQRPASLVESFEGFELTDPHEYFRLSVARDGFVRHSTRLGDTGAWQIIDDQLLLSLPPCDLGYVTYGTLHKCGGFDGSLPLFEAAPSSRMRFYGSASLYVRDE